MDIHGAGLAVEIEAPGLLEQLLTCEDTSGLAGEGEQQFEFLGAQVERLTGDARLAADGINGQVGQVDGGGIRLGERVRPAARSP